VDVEVDGDLDIARARQLLPFQTRKAQLPKVFVSISVPALLKIS
jgi:hypothetical protein